jgi:hypothetical protein
MITIYEIGAYLFSADCYGGYEVIFWKMRYGWLGPPCMRSCLQCVIFCIIIISMQAPENHQLVIRLILVGFVRVSFSFNMMSCRVSNFHDVAKL